MNPHLRIDGYHRVHWGHGGDTNLAGAEAVVAEPARRRRGRGAAPCRQLREQAEVVIAMTVTVPAMLVAFFATQTILSGNHVQIDFGHSGVARAVFGSALYLTIAGLLGIGLGGIFRSTAAAVTSLTVILFVMPVIVFILPASLSNSIRPSLPGNAGQAIMNIVPQAHTLAPWVGLGVFTAYALAAIAGAAILLVKRDS